MKQEEQMTEIVWDEYSIGLMLICVVLFTCIMRLMESEGCSPKNIDWTQSEDTQHNSIDWIGESKSSSINQL